MNEYSINSFSNICQARKKVLSQQFGFGNLFLTYSIFFFFRNLNKYANVENLDNDDKCSRLFLKLEGQHYPNIQHLPA